MLYTVCFHVKQRKDSFMPYLEKSINSFNEHYAVLSIQCYVKYWLLYEDSSSLHVTM